MGRVSAHREYAASDFRVHRLNAPVQHFGESSDVGYVAYSESCAAQRLGRTARRDQLDSKVAEFAGEVDDSGLIGDAQQGAFDFGHRNNVNTLPWRSLETARAARPCV